MNLYFITGNKNKFEEIKSVLSDIERLAMDLPEIQEVDLKKIIEAKLKEALNHKAGEFIVEDTGLYLECLKGLPGPLIKWFLETFALDEFAKIAEKLGNNRAEAKITKKFIFLRARCLGRSFLPAANQISAGIRFFNQTDTQKLSQKWMTRDANL
ncbi:MAG: Ham1 family protein [Candidatus Giovannonibacteria bacterium GW2011_GWC2_43_8]|nr:MAG: Ham1 family protein [Candidatus Giovannonibacteria bacterium GW2011_GWC2_43_8]